jgi:DUF438 domain-containing protein
MLYDEYLAEIETVSPENAMEVFDNLLQRSIPFEIVKSNVGKIMNIFYKSLESFPPIQPSEDHFLYFMMLENREMEKRMQEVKDVVKSFQGAADDQKKKYFRHLRDRIEALRPYELHYIKKENILFPLIESRYPSYRCLQLMWAFHDDFRVSLKALDQILNAESPDEQALNRELGKLFFVVLPIIFREEKVVYPMALRMIPEEVWPGLAEQSFEVGWCYISEPRLKGADHKFVNDLPGELVDLETGALSAAQIIMMMENLPVDITYIDENDEVRYFSGIKHRIFPRSKAIIGRKVQNCHPPSSVHIVNEIVDAFKSGERDVAEFWIQMKGRFIHIRYYALRDSQQNYRGTIEVSQDVTGIRELQGEQRLLSWK